MNLPGQSTSKNPPIEVVHRSENEENDGSQKLEPEKHTISHDAITQNGVPSGSPEPITPPGSAVEVEHLFPPDWTPPFYARYRLLTGAAGFLTLIWLVFISYNYFSGFLTSSISALLPHELGILLAGLLGPIVLMWIFVGYFERSKVFEKESAALRWHLKQLTFPTEAESARASKVTDALRNQAYDLTCASEEVSERAQAARNLIRTQTADLLTASRQVSLNADTASEKLRQQGEDVV
ncbi:MAG: hypothetical protein NZ707_04035, partial [Rhodospirillales bacterium]|nr:hypothetical protein [Rhodospirillales bacterium]